MFLTNKDWENIHTAVTRHFFPVTASIGYKGYRQQYCLFSFPNFNPVTRRGGHWKSGHMCRAMLYPNLPPLSSYTVKVIVGHS